MPTEVEVTTTELRFQIVELKVQRNAALDNSVYRAGRIMLAEKQITAMKSKIEQLEAQLFNLEIDSEVDKTFKRD